MENNSVMRKIMPITSVILPQNYLENYGEYLIISGLFAKNRLGKKGYRLTGTFRFSSGEYVAGCNVIHHRGMRRVIPAEERARNNVIMLWKYYALLVM